MLDDAGHGRVSVFMLDNSLVSNGFNKCLFNIISWDGGGHFHSRRPPGLQERMSMVPNRFYKNDMVGYPILFWAPPLVGNGFSWFGLHSILMCLQRRCAVWFCAQPWFSMEFNSSDKVSTDFDNVECGVSVLILDAPHWFPNACLFVQ